MSWLLAVLMVIPWFGPGSTLKVMNPGAAQVFKWNGFVLNIGAQEIRNYQPAGDFFGFVLLESDTPLQAWCTVEGATFTGSIPKTQQVLTASLNTGVVLVNPWDTDALVAMRYAGVDSNVTPYRIGGKQGHVFLVHQLFESRAEEGLLYVVSSLPLAVAAARPDGKGRYETVPVMEIR